VKYLNRRHFKTIDAGSSIRGKDFLLKIWEMLLSVPIGIAIISKDLDPYTLANIFYEIGLLHAYGKETVVIKTKDCFVPSDFIRTEFIEYDRSFGSKINKFLDHLKEQSEYYYTTAKLVKENPLLAIDYLRRAYLIQGNSKYKNKASSIFKTSNFDKQTLLWIKNFL
jgi:hypothetical protein